ncbi:hypothetical protein ACHAXS_009958 [Conticribra weissflogii]
MQTTHPLRDIATARAFAIATAAIVQDAAKRMMERNAGLPPVGSPSPRGEFLEIRAPTSVGSGGASQRREEFVVAVGILKWGEAETLRAEECFHFGRGEGRGGGRPSVSGGDGEEFVIFRVPFETLCCGSFGSGILDLGR